MKVGDRVVYREHMRTYFGVIRDLDSTGPDPWVDVEAGTLTDQQILRIGSYRDCCVSDLRTNMRINRHYFTPLVLADEFDKP